MLQGMCCCLLANSFKSICCVNYWLSVCSEATAPTQIRFCAALAMTLLCSALLLLENFVHPLINIKFKLHFHRDNSRIPFYCSTKKQLHFAINVSRQVFAYKIHYKFPHLSPILRHSPPNTERERRCCVP